MVKHVMRVVLFGGAVAAAFTPISFQGAGGVASSTAICPTCCPQAGATCVICGTVSCVKESGYYEGKTGPNGCVYET